MNEEFVDNIITNLNIIGILKINEKLCIRKGHLQIDASSNFQSIRRWCFRDSREINIIYINKLLNDITLLFGKVKEYPKDECLWIISRILTELDKIEEGIGNIKKTYFNDPYMIAVYDNVFLKFKQLTCIGKELIN